MNILVEMGKKISNDSDILHNSFYLRVRKQADACIIIFLSLIHIIYASFTDHIFAPRLLITYLHLPCLLTAYLQLVTPSIEIIDFFPRDHKLLP